MEAKKLTPEQIKAIERAKKVKEKAVSEQKIVKK